MEKGEGERVGGKRELKGEGEEERKRERSTRIRVYMGRERGEEMNERGGGEMKEGRKEGKGKGDGGRKGKGKGDGRKKSGVVVVSWHRC